MADRPATPAPANEAPPSGGAPVAGPPPPHPLVTVNLVAQIAFGLIAMTICLPSMPQWGALLGAGQAGVQFTFSGYLLAFGCLQLVYGPLSDRHGRKRVLLAGLTLALAGSVLAAFAHDLSGLVVARVVQGAGAAAGTVVGRASVQDLFDGPQRTRVMATIGMAMGLCPPAATIVGGQLHERFGWQSNFVLVAALAVVMLVAAWRGLPATGTRPPPRSHWLREMLDAYARLAREPGFVLHVAVLAATVATFYAFLGGAPLVLRSYGIGPSGVGVYIMVVPVSYIGGNFLTSRLVRRLGERPLMAIGQGLTATGIALVILLGLAGQGGPLAFTLPLVLLGIGHGLLMPTCLAGTVGLVPALAGAAAGVAGLAQQFTGALGGWVVGWVRHDGPVNLGLLMLGFTLCAIGAQAALHRRPRRG